MCGVCGIVPLGPTVISQRSRDRVAGMVKALAHRGPDSSGVASSDSETVFLGATRLAIRGLGSGKQPIVHDSSGIVVVCNGEIDNHRELRQWLAERGRHVRQETDVAVIPELYLELGEEFVEKLQGVFAIAIWDPRKQTLLLARDRAGERPLFYSVSDGVARFATEIAALASDSGAHLTLAPKFAHEYLQYGCLVSPASPFAEVQKVSPGQIVIISMAGIRRQRYWRWKIGEAKKQPGDVKAFDPIFRYAVQSQIEADVPFGVFLSGGLDSSLVAAVARSLRPNTTFNAYSLRFHEASYDEGCFAEEVAARLGLNFISVWVEPQMLPGTLKELLHRVGEPLADPAWIPTALLAQRAARDVKLALAGEGGDEVFGGYPTYIAAQLGEKFARLPGPVRGAIRKLIDALPESEKKVTISFLLKRFVHGTQTNGVARHLFWKAQVSEEILARLGLDAHLSGIQYNPETPLLDAVQQIDFETTLAEGLLTKADRATMASALEVRAPFLNPGVMDYAATLPAIDRVRGFTTKHFLKEYALAYLPRNIVHRRKRGLSVPLAQWLRGPLRDWACDVLSADLLPEAGIDKKTPLALFKEHCARQSDHTRVLWALIVLAEWLKWRRAL
jgi:asparagine synthase (glutamine-hydrolysing)